MGSLHRFQSCLCFITLHHVLHHRGRLLWARVGAVAVLHGAGGVVLVLHEAVAVLPHARTVHSLSRLRDLHHFVRVVRDINTWSAENCTWNVAPSRPRLHILGVFFRDFFLQLLCHRGVVVSVLSSISLVPSSLRLKYSRHIIWDVIMV